MSTTPFDIELYKRLYMRLRLTVLPNVTIRFKRLSWSQKVINFFMSMFVYKDMYYSYYTTFRNTIYSSCTSKIPPNRSTVPFTEFTTGNWIVFCHEATHILKQIKKYTYPLFAFLYAFPISIGILVLLTGMGSSTYLLFVNGYAAIIVCMTTALISASLCMPGLPTPWRRNWELEAYTVTMHLYHLRHGKLPADYIKWVVSQFQSKTYWVMEPNFDKITQEINARAVAIQIGRSPVKDYAIVRIAEEEFARLQRDMKSGHE